MVSLDSPFLPCNRHPTCNPVRAQHSHPSASLPWNPERIHFRALAPTKSDFIIATGGHTLAWIGFYLLSQTLISTFMGACVLSRFSCGLWLTRLLCPWDSPGKNTGMGCHALPSKGSSWRRDLACVSCIASRFFTTITTWEAPNFRSNGIQILNSELKWKF